MGKVQLLALGNYVLKENIIMNLKKNRMLTKTNSGSAAALSFSIKRLVSGRVISSLAPGPYPDSTSSFSSSCL
jgi:hypothetical protein